MNQETQYVEWKTQWRDEYLKWICGFANAGGGVLVIGRNDKGDVTGLPNAHRLLEELPNKVRDILGILVTVNLRTKDEKEYLEIEVEAYPNPISYKGEYYQRSGSTNQMLKGAALNRFILRRHGRTWDSVPLPGIGVDDLDAATLKTFRRLALKSRRFSKALLNEPDRSLLEKLHLTEKQYLTRAAALLFHSDPERFFRGAAIKIGYFASESDLRYHDEIQGSLFLQSEKALDLLQTKYLKAVIGYEGIHRVESLPVPEPALREALLNAIVHRDYAVAAPIQIRVYDNRLTIWNPGALPEDWTLKKLLGPHASQPYNPNIANAFFRAGEIETWGRGIERVFATCREARVPEPRIRVEPGDVWFEFPFSPEYLEGITGGGTREKTSGKASEKTSEKTSEKILAAIRLDRDVTIAQLAEIAGVTTRTIERNLTKLQAAGRVERVGPDKGGHWVVKERT